MDNGECQETIKEFLKATEETECKMEGVNDYLAFYNIVVIYECLGELEKAKHYYMKCKGYELAD